MAAAQAFGASVAAVVLALEYHRPDADLADAIGMGAGFRLKVCGFNRGLRWS